MEERRKRFIAYFDRTWKPHGGRKAFMAKTGMDKSRVAQLFKVGQPFGELAGRKLAKRLGLPENYFEVREGGFSRRALELARMFDAAPDGGEKDRWFAAATVFLESMEAQEEMAAAPDLFESPIREPARTE